MKLKKYSKNYIIFLTKKLKIIIFLILLIFLVFEDQEIKKKYLEQSYELMLKAIGLKSKFWGIQYFLDFCWYYQQRDKQRYQSYDLESLEFQEYLNTQYAMFRLTKTSILVQITDICKNILDYQIKENSLQKSKHAAMVVIKSLNDSMINENQIDAQDARKAFLELCGITDKTPLNIFEVLVEHQILIQQENIFGYKNQGVFNYFYNFSSELMPLFKTSVNEQIRYVKNSNLESELNRLEQIYIDFESEIQVYEKHKEFFKLKELILDWSDPEQYYEFEDKKLQAVYLDLNKIKLQINDKMFQSLVINIVGMGYYWYSKENKLDNYYYFMEK